MWGHHFTGELVNSIAASLQIVELLVETDFSESLNESFV